MSSSDTYYEDVDPRFTTDPAKDMARPPQLQAPFEDPRINGGSRSPADSERSNFTSVSQRGVNPRWNPAPPMPGYQGPAPRRGVAQYQQRQDILLNSNPDFQLNPREGRGQ
jgi:hypothetical protein